MLGLGSINQTLNNLGLAVELQSVKLVVESANDLNKYVTDNNVSATTIHTARKLMASLSSPESVVTVTNNVTGTTTTS